METVEFRVFILYKVHYIFIKIGYFIAGREMYQFVSELSTMLTYVHRG